MFPTGSIGNIFLVGIVTYAAVRHRLMDIDLFVMRAAATFLTSVALLLPVAAGLLWVRHGPPFVGYLAAVGSILLALGLGILAFARFRSLLEQKVESSLFPARYAARDAIRQLSAEMVKLGHRDDLTRRFSATLMNGLGLNGIALYLRTANDRGFRLACSEGTICAPRSVHGRSVAEAIAPNSDAVVFTAQASGEEPLGTVQPDAWEAYVPIRANGASLGFIALAAKRSGAAIDDTDVTLLSLVSAQLAIALKNIEYVKEIERQKAEIEELQKEVEAENVVLRAEVRAASQFKEIIGSSPALQRVLVLVEKTAPTPASILILGETGTGKELIARAIHDLSSRRNGPLICVNCPAIPTELAESELFGHERGAFTGAIESRPGKFELAHGGTIFLDEVADLPMSVQVKLLRVLQEHEIQRLGSRSVRKLDLRVVAATNRDLKTEIDAGRFREDLFYRLVAVRLEVPALRERSDDIPMLASYFLQRAATVYQKAISGFTPEAVAALLGYNWPGNIRELQNVVERAVLLCGGDSIRPEHLSELALPSRRQRPFGAAIREEKLRRIREALEQTGGNQAAAARLLGMTPSNFSRLLRNLGLKPPPEIQ